MVTLNKIYTRTGDKGDTGLATGARVPKDDLRVEAYGTVDECNAAIGLAVVEAERANVPGIVALLRNIQNDLFDIGADLAVPSDAEVSWKPLRLDPAQVDKLEEMIDHHNAGLAPLDSFVLPGGSPLSAQLHMARTIARRAERVTVSLRREATISEACMIYLNRLSDLLFVLSRCSNDQGKNDVKWVPGGVKE